MIPKSKHGTAVLDWCGGGGGGTASQEDRTRGGVSQNAYAGGSAPSLFPWGMWVGSAPLSLAGPLSAWLCGHRGWCRCCRDGLIGMLAGLRFVGGTSPVPRCRLGGVLCLS